MRAPGTILSALTLLAPAIAGAHPTHRDDQPVSSRGAPHGRTIPTHHRHTAVRVVAPRAGSVLVYEGGALVARVDGRDTILLPTGRTYDLAAFRSGHLLWRGEVAATTDRMDVVWNERSRSPVVERWLDPESRRPTGDFPNAGRAAMDPDAFHILADNLRHERTDAGRMEMIRAVAARNLLSIAQLGGVLYTLRFESNRLWATEALRARIVDPSRADSLLPLFDFEASRARVRSIFRDWS